MIAATSITTRSGQQGFTLLEVLLATSLLALAVGLTAAAVHGVLNAQARTEQRVRIVEVRDGTSNALRESLGAMAPIPFLTPQGSEALFVGKSTRMDFVAIQRSYAGAGGEVRHTLSTVQDAHGLSLCLAIGVPDQPAPSQCEPVPRAVVASGLRSIRFRYRGHDADGKLEAWRAQWPRTGMLPEWIEVSIVPLEGKAWPPILVAIPLSVRQETI